MAENDEKEQGTSKDDNKGSSAPKPDSSSRPPLSSHIEHSANKGDINIKTLGTSNSNGK